MFNHPYKLYRNLVRYRITSNSKSVTKILSHNKLRRYFDNKSNMKRFAYFNRQHLITCVFANLTQHSFYRKSHKFIIYKTNLKNNCPSHPFVQEIKSILCSGTVWKIPLVLTRKEVFSFNTWPEGSICFKSVLKKTFKKKKPTKLLVQSRTAIYVRIRNWRQNLSCTHSPFKGLFTSWGVLVFFGFCFHFRKHTLHLKGHIFFLQL